MTGGRGIGFAVATAVSLVGGAAAQRAPTVAPLQLPDSLRVGGAEVADVDGDGREDLLVAAHRRGESYARVLRVHLGRAGGVYDPQPEAELWLPPDVVAFALADVDGGPGAEVVLLNARRAVAWRPGVEGAEAFVELLARELLWQVADRRRVASWQRGVCDLDGDGRDDLLLPAPDGYVVALQTASDRESADEPVVRFETVLELRLPERDSRGDADGSRPRRGGSIELTLDGDAHPSGPLLEIEEVVPAPWTVDFDADGDLDVVALGSEHLLLWRQGPRRELPRSPRRSRPLPLPGDRASRLDLVRRAHLADVDGDGRPDCVLLAGDYRKDAVRTQVLVFLQQEDGTLFGEDGLPRQLLVLGGLAGGTEVADVDGDGRPDLFAGTVRPDVIGAIGGGASDSVDLELYVYRGHGRALSRRPDLVHPVAVEGEALTAGSAARLFADADGDGTRDLLLRPRRDRVSVLPLRASGEELEVGARPLWERRIDPESRVMPAPRGAASAGLLVLEPTQVLHVRWR